ncbi:flagellar biosynthesis protein FlhA [Paenibacillus larvae]|uniref:Flagellar biosynthesis protein FlhA n=4 Tax=Paenibacillus larvae TaxID=1464 RepID=V9W9Z3_9BACL|nr:flagellar biosynthesis protein FlhA [Paenibacillus larvae]AHD05942.1 flagellar biosynthesis protein FlhA [Paenibacillus larvae subsp. larvae DSM 25430]AQR76614.1 flagellar biosynthesis protein FlhA [Paenibacillus larvae subsp. larvae]AQT83635.1 flagellar biosynthesis protein FlhA [Paenibacillus larvae subsp. pulvifaciens]AQZ48769.1 flagellar biosynthesis protein FlhA [Paenibacillus larvae subsp. pulvifaciens]ARF69930.1 flagellar biosynthesis protein FlhA [Paenibacillus larvae subsp. pulvifa
MKPKELTVLIGVIAIVIMMVVPIPPALLDVLLILNITIALTIILIGMNTQEALQFSIFPSLLLITTLFRLALNISTTRNILAHAEAGNVVATFGKFVAAGNIVVGFIVFIILVLVQFIVITKGSERVAEVAARFTLDAMPGKQMSIDADLNAGLINEQEARTRRQKIEKEADFYGAMDGATKFVKGDAIAGIIILLINIIGGLIIGMTMKGMSLAEAAETYSILTIGDGLVSQIPALLISTAAGIIVTRATSEGNLGSDITDQITSYPKLLYIVAGTLAFLGIFTPIHWYTTIPIALLLAAGAWKMEKNLQQKQEQEEQMEEEQQIEEVRSPESVISLLQVDPIEFEFGYGLIPLADTSQGGDLLDRIILIRRQCALELGIVVPVIRIRDNIQLKPNEYIIKIKGNIIAKGELLLNHYLAMSPGVDDETVSGIETTEPAFGLPALWIDEPTKERAELSGYTVVDPPSVVATHLTEVIKKHAHELIGRQETKTLIENVKETYPALVDDLIPNVLTIGDVQKVLANLLKEKVSVRDLVTILESLADYGAYTKDPDILTEYVRQALSRQITQQYASQEDALRVITVGPAMEKKIAESVQQTEQGSYLALDPSSSQIIFHKLNEQISKMVHSGHQPIILTSPTIRMYVKQLLERTMQEIPVLSYSELEPNVEIQSVGVVNL